jgi:hypothetical protein
MLTYAKAASVLAIVLAVGTTADAALVVGRGAIGPKQLRRAAVTAPKLATNAVTDRAVLALSLRPRDVDVAQLEGGDDGPLGLKGPQGKPGRKVLERLDYRSEEHVIHAGFVGSLRVPCDSTRYKVVGGGVRITGLATGQVAVLDSLPDGRDAWQGEGGNLSPGDQTMTVTVICTTARATTP